LSFIAPAARATEPQPVEPVLLHATRWYGWQNLMGDGIALSFGALAVAIDADGASNALGSVSSLVYLGASPLIHSSHGEAGSVFGSLGLRFGLPTAGLLIGFAVARGCSFYPGGCDDALRGASVGVVSAMAIDAALLAHEDVCTGPDGEQVSRTAPFLMPGVFIGREQLLLGVHGVL
jgi:hypothetical protein